MLKFSSLVTVATRQVLNSHICLVSVKWISIHTEHPHYRGKFY